MLKLSQPITSINGFKIGDKVRLKDGDGRSHIIKSFSIDGMKEFFFEVQFEDGAETMLDNIALLPSDIDEAAEEALDDVDANWQIDERDGECTEPGYNQKQMLYMYKTGAEWMAGQGESIVAKIGLATEKICCTISEKTLDSLGVRAGDEIIVQIRKKQ